MATSKEKKYDLTSCPICLETYTSPRCLPCLHNFCEQCLQTFINKHITKADSGYGILCPLCRLFVKKPDHTSAHEWAKEFPGNHLINSVIDMELLKTLRQNCHECARETETESAHSWCLNCREALCRSCERNHRRNKSSRGHKLIDIEDITSDDKQLQTSDLFCPDHPEKVLEAYCSDHSMVCCTSCALLKHRKCEDVGTIEDAATKLKNSGELEQLQLTFENMSKHIRKIIDNRKQNIRDIQNSISDIRKEIDESFDLLIKTLEGLKMSTLGELSATEKDVIPELKSESEEATCKLSALENNIRVVESSLKHAFPAVLLSTANKLSEQKTVLEDFIKQSESTMKEICIHYVKNEKLTTLLHTVRDFGRLSIEKSNMNIPCHCTTLSQSNPVDMLNVSATLSKSVDFPIHIPGIAVFNDGRIIISLWIKKELALLGSDFTTLSTLSTRGCPSGIQMFTDTDGAVAITGSCLLLFRVNGDTIIKTNRLQVPVSYDFIYHKDHYYIGSYSKIIVRDSSFCCIRDIGVDGNLRCIAARDDTTLCYTLYGGSTLFCTTLDGTTVFRYSHDKLRNTKGVTLDHAGHIYVCDWQTRTVHQLTRDGKLQRIIIDNMPDQPYSISFNGRCNQVVIGCRRSLLVYDLK